MESYFGVTLIKLLLILVWTRGTNSFSVSPVSCSRPSHCNQLLCQWTRHHMVPDSSSDGEDSSVSPSDMYGEEEIQEMKGLVLSLSLETSDETRRQRVVDVFDEALARPNGMPKRFTDLFDKTLMKIGDEVQSQAKKKYFEDQAAEEAENVKGASNEGSEESDEGGDADDDTQKIRTKSPQEQQLWALVDMMVQTKTIVKRANGDLGSKGTFQ